MLKNGQYHQKWQNVKTTILKCQVNLRRTLLEKDQLSINLKIIGKRLKMTIIKTNIFIALRRTLWEKDQK
jgi:hypothetical protein